MRWIKRILTTLVIVWFGGVFFLGVNIGLWISEVPPLDGFSAYHPFQTTYFYDKDRNIIGCIGNPWRDVIPKDTIIGLSVTHAVIAIEDERFFRRDWPLDAQAILRAFWKNVQARKIVEGGSTIEQQLVKQLLPPEERKERSVWRKFKELVLGFQLVKEFSKEEILYLYLNEAYLGHNRNGVEAASLFYFGKHAADISLAEAATLAGMIHAPEKVSPRKHPLEAVERRNIVLQKMYSIGFINMREYDEAMHAPLVISDSWRQLCRKEPYVVRHARRELKRSLHLAFDPDHENLAWRGMRVYTTLDPTMQDIAYRGIQTALSEYHARQKEKAVDANAAMIVFDNATGGILAMIGSRNAQETQYNHATQAHRQAGSSFKPIVYASYFTRLIEDSGVDPETILNRSLSNARFSCRGRTKFERWNPNNFDDRKNSAGSYRIRDAIAKSINRPALHAAQDGPCSLHISVVLTARRMGIESPLGVMEGPVLRFRLPIAIGAADLTLLEMARAYMVMPNGGVFVPDHIVDRVTMPDGMPIYQFTTPQTHQALRADVANLLVEALQGVTTRGTASSMKTIKQPTAGKTGTTNGYRDTWFIGFTPSITAGVWVGGKDKTVSLGDRETGGKTALPAFKQLIGEWYSAHPIEPFPELNSCRALARTTPH